MKKNKFRFLSLFGFIILSSFLMPLASIRGDIFQPNYSMDYFGPLGVTNLLIAPSKAPSSQQARLRGNLTISGAWALYPLVVRWAEEFRRQHPGVRIDVQAGGAGKGVTDVLSGAAQLAMVSRELHPEEKKRGAVALAVAKDAVVLTASEKNPYLKVLLTRGLTREELVDIWISGKIKRWGDLLKESGKEAINLYTRSDACGAGETWAAFLGAKQEDLLGTGIYGDPGVAEAVKRDPFGLGYNNLNFAYDPKTDLPIKGLIILPIDLNGNGRVDPEENFTADRQSVIKAIREGRYPSPPARNLYFVLRDQPQSPLVIAFLSYVLEEGQKIVPEAGYIEVSPQALQEAKAVLAQIKIR